MTTQPTNMQPARQPNMQTKPPFNRPQTCNHHKPFQPGLTEQRTKELIMETLIELNLVPKPQKRKTVNV